MIKTILPFFNLLLRSVFVSSVMFVICFSIVTGTFPPDFARLKTTYHNLQQMAALSQSTVPAETAPRPGETKPFDEERDVATLEAINRKRAEFGQGLLPAGPLRPRRHAASAGADTENLHRQMRDLQSEVFRLQQRVNELEETRRQHDSGSAQFNPL